MVGTIIPRLKSGFVGWISTTRKGALIIDVPTIGGASFAGSLLKRCVSYLSTWLAHLIALDNNLLGVRKYDDPNMPPMRREEHHMVSR